ncbi:serine/threonine protein kinase [Desulfobulbus sp. AH-315-M07]|nr:serine/threonine protein kinase [Desulfobulbus sp. AH-315-M07]
MELTPGALVQEKLRLIEQLGEGGMGTIWLADHLDAGKQVAVKFMSRELLMTDSTAIDRFEREAVILERVDHPNIVTLVGYGRADDGTPFIALELMSGQPLVDFLESDGLLDCDEMLEVIEQLASAIDALHGLGIIHRDIKAENIFIERRGEHLHVTLFDFGLTKRPEDPSVPSKAKPVTGVGVMVGTAEYMSPEQMISSKDVDFNADLWALAVVAYAALCGGLPFRGKNFGAIFRQFSKSDFPRPSTLREDIPPEVDRWFERAFKPTIPERFGNGAAMAKSLRNALLDRVPPSVRQPLPAEIKRGPGSLGPGSGVASMPQPSNLAALTDELMSSRDVTLPSETLSQPSETLLSGQGVPRWAIAVLVVAVLVGAGGAFLLL